MNRTDPRTPSCRLRAAREQKQRTCIDRHALTGGHRIQKQIIGILKEHEAGVSVADLCRKHGVSDASIYNWKARFGGMDVSEARRLKRLLADAMLDNAALRELLAKNVWSAPSVQGFATSLATIPVA